MKVALVVERLEAWRGGAETSTQQFIRHLSDMGIELEIFTRTQGHELSLPTGIEVHTIQPNAATRSGRSACFARTVDRQLADANVDLVHAITPCIKADIYQPRGGTIVETIARNLALRRSRASRSLKRVANLFNFRQRLMLDIER